MPQERMKVPHTSFVHIRRFACFREGKAQRQFLDLNAPRRGKLYWVVSYKTEVLNSIQWFSCFDKSRHNTSRDDHEGLVVLGKTNTSHISNMVYRAPTNVYII